MTNLFNYIDRKSPIHALTGATKLVCLVLWSTACMITFDTRFLVIMPFVAFALMKMAKIKYKDISFILNFTLFFMVFNNIVIYLFSPQYGTEIYGTKHFIFNMTGSYALTLEQLFYHFNQMVKCLAIVPIVILFVCTTEPSEFAASLNKLKVPYSVAYSVSLALRYIPDIQREYHEISQAQQARGIEMSKKENIIKRLKAASAILIPLILSSMDKIETISNAMELRSFGKYKERTWYRSRPFKKADILSMIGCAFLVIIAIVLNVVNGGRFFNPFI